MQRPRLISYDIGTRGRQNSGFELTVRRTASPSSTFWRRYNIATAAEVCDCTAGSRECCSSSTSLSSSARVEETDNWRSDLTSLASEPDRLALLKRIQAVPLVHLWPPQVRGFKVAREPAEGEGLQRWSPGEDSGLRSNGVKRPDVSPKHNAPRTLPGIVSRSAGRRESNQIPATG